MENILVSFPPFATAATANRYIRWNNNNNNISGAILNVDGSCHGTTTRTGFGGVLRNDSGLFIAGFSGFIPDSDDILLAELFAIYHGIITAKVLGYTEFACYSDSLVCINLINGPIEMYHIYVVLIQDIKHLLHQINVTVSHTLREGNCWNMYGN
jgi:ribonuclease HI